MIEILFIVVAISILEDKKYSSNFFETYLLR